jgi:penicillin-binding protein-related factor A (putative recombinase)
MAINKGKEWERQFREDWERCFPNTFCFRLKDQESKKKHTSKNPCDFICFPKSKLLLLELKSHKGNTFSFDCFKQYDLLESYKDVETCVCGIILWFRDHKKVIFVRIEEIIKMKERDGLKSINIKMLQTKEYDITEIPCDLKDKRRTYPKCDYTDMVDRVDSE